MKIVVTFKNSSDDLVCMFTKKFKTVEEAKREIERDGTYFQSNHLVRKNGRLCRGTAGWKNPNFLDFYQVKGGDGESCIWQYFKV